MYLPSYADVFSVRLERESDEQIQVGDVVRSGANLFPHFEVLAVCADKAWVRNTQTGADHLTYLSRCRKLAPEPTAPATW